MTDPTPIGLRLAAFADIELHGKPGHHDRIVRIARALDEAGVAKAVDVLERLTMPVCSFHKRRALANDALAALRGETK